MPTDHVGIFSAPGCKVLIEPRIMPEAASQLKKLTG